MIVLRLARSPFSGTEEEQSGDRAGMYGRGPNASACNDEVVAGAHALHGFDDIFLVIWDDFDSLQLHSEGEAELG